MDFSKNYPALAQSDVLKKWKKNVFFKFDKDFQNKLNALAENKIHKLFTYVMAHITIC
jgi:hypothetical protein